jgi:hypothetical protein
MFIITKYVSDYDLFSNVEDTYNEFKRMLEQNDVKFKELKLQN